MSRARVQAAVFLALAAAWRLLLFVGPQGSDDLVYSELARDLASGRYRLKTDIFTLRLGYVSPIAAVYAVFGAGSFALVLFNFAASVAELALAWKVARSFLDGTGARWAVLLLALFPLHAFYATEAHPDVPVSLLTTAAAALYLRARAEDRKGLYLAAGLALGAGHLMKESAFFGLAALALLGRPRPRAAWTLAGFLAVAAAESVFYAAAAGDALYRVRAAGSEQARIMASEFYVRNVPTWRRILVDVPSMFFWPAGGFFPFVMFLPWAALAGAAVAVARRDAALRPAALWGGSLLALLVLWPIQWIPYRPAMVAHPRIFLVAAVPMALLAAYFLRSIPRVPARVGLALLAVSSAAASWALHRDGRHWTAAAREAYARLPEGATVVADPRTAGLFRLYRGYPGKDPRPIRDWDAPEPERPYVRAENGTWQRCLREWYGVRPPAWFAGEGRVLAEGEVPRRRSLRQLLRGRGYQEGDPFRVVLVPR